MSQSLERDVAAARQVQLLAALLNHDAPPWRDGELPPLAHWLLFPPATRQSNMGQDGHPSRDEDGLPRRMWAGSRVQFLAPIGLGVEVVRETTQLSATNKTGRSGRMRFETLLHRFRVNGTLCLEEEQDIVYRAAGKNAALSPPDAAAVAPEISRSVFMDSIQLFRYSALTFNAHRIHYDLPYATETEGYPGLVVHGPFIATLLMDLFLRHRPQAAVKSFSFRAQRPIFCHDAFTLGLSPDQSGGDLVAIDAADALAVIARIDLA